MSRTSTQPELVSIGYEGRDLDDLLAQLFALQVSVLVDVRLNATSRKAGLSKTKLSAALSEVGIGYVHEPGLGNPRDNREGLRAGSGEAVDRFWQILRGRAGNEALAHVMDMLEGGVVALLCFEREHGMCHRGLVAEAIRRQVPEVRLHAV